MLRQKRVARVGEREEVIREITVLLGRQRRGPSILYDNFQMTKGLPFADLVEIWGVRDHFISAKRTLRVEKSYLHTITH